MNALGWTLVASVREHAMGKASHRGHGGHRGGRLIDQCAWVDTGGFRAGTRVWERHRTEVTEVIEEAGGSMNALGGTPRLLWDNTRRHRGRGR